MTEYQFDQLVAEMRCRWGTDIVFRALEIAAHIYGWPIRPKHRENAIRFLAFALLEIAPEKKSSKINGPTLH